MTTAASRAQFAAGETTEPGGILLEPSVHMRNDSVVALLPKRNGHAETIKVSQALLEQRLARIAAFGVYLENAS